MRAGEVSNTKAQSFHHGRECVRTSHASVWGFVTMYIDYVPVADAGVPPVPPRCPPLHLGDGAGMRAGELSHTKA